MRIFERAGRFFRPRLGRQKLVSLLPLALLFATWPQNLSAQQDEQDPAQAAPRQRHVQQTPGQLQQLVAPIALYPDSLVAQILAAATFPEQVVEADTWVQAHPDLKGDALGQAVDQQPWDPSVKALTAFPSVLGNMDKNLSWTSSIGDAFYNQEQDLMDAVQEMRQRAQEAGNLKTTPQQTVTAQGSTIIIEPTSPEVVYVPAYNPWLVYGGPVEAWPGWYEYPRISYGDPYLSFGVGYGISYYGGYGWGWHHWGSDWYHRSVTYDHDRYHSRSRTFYKRNDYYRAGEARGGFNGGERDGYRTRTNEGSRPPNGNTGGRSGDSNRPGARTRPFNGDTQAARGLGEPRGQSGVRSGAFSGYDHADKKGAFRHVEAPALAVVVVSRIGNRRIVMFLWPARFRNGESDMRRTKPNFNKFDWANLFEMAAVGILLAGGFPVRSVGQQRVQKAFSSPENASNALVTAAQRNDEEAMIDILGPDGKQIVSSGDETEDAHSRANFVQKYQEMHRLVKEPDGTTILYIGAKNWPTPIPLVKQGDSWYFDTEAGRKEILYRRIGRNEMATIRVCQELAAAEKEFYSAQHNEYAQKIFSDEGQHNGLYWKTADGEPQSPIGSLVASAVAEGYTKDGDGAPTPYRGYYYHMLTRQGKNGPGGAKSYIVNGKMRKGFAFVAYPAEYRSSGVMTFIVNQDGVVYQKDLGKKTEVLAKDMKEYNPDSSWEKAEEQQSAEKRETK